MLRWPDRKDLTNLGLTCIEAGEASPESIPMTFLFRGSARGAIAGSWGNSMASTASPELKPFGVHGL